MPNRYTEQTLTHLLKLKKERNELVKLIDLVRNDEATVDVSIRLDPNWVNFSSRYEKASYEKDMNSSFEKAVRAHALDSLEARLRQIDYKFESSNLIIED